MAVQPEKKYQKFKRALKLFNPTQITILYNDLGGQQCKFKQRLPKICVQKSKGCPDAEEWPLEFCIRKHYIKSTHYLIELGLSLEHLTCGLEMALTKTPRANLSELIKTLLKAGPSITSFVWLEQFVKHYADNPKQSNEVLRSLCSIPTDPTIRYHILGMFLHYCCTTSRNYDEIIHTNNCCHRFRLDISLFNISWYKTLEYLIFEGLDLRAYKDKELVDATLDCYKFCQNRYSSPTPHMDTSIMSIMIRLATGSAFSEIIFAEYAQQNCEVILYRFHSRRDTGGHEQEFLELLPMFYHVGIDVCSPRFQVVFTGRRVEQYSGYIASLKEHPRALRDIACLRVRHALSGPNVLISSRALTGLPTSIREMLTLQTLDITRSLEPECDLN